jgi:hypothetical protein
MLAHSTPGLIRPTCPDLRHAGGRVWLGGFYGRNGFHERPRWWCVPPTRSDQPAWKRHRFSEPLRRRHSTDAEHGKQCEVCEHVPRPDQGPVTGRGFSYTITEAARALVSGGEGLTYRTTSYKTRRHARPLREDREDETSDHPQLVMNYLDAFGDEIYSRYAEIEWPEVLILDALPQHEKDTMVGAPSRSWPPTGSATARASCGASASTAPRTPTSGSASYGRCPARCAGWCATRPAPSPRRPARCGPT